MKHTEIKNQMLFAVMNTDESLEDMFENLIEDSVVEDGCVLKVKEEEYSIIPFNAVNYTDYLDTFNFYQLIKQDKSSE